MGKVLPGKPACWLHAGLLQTRALCRCCATQLTMRPPRRCCTTLQVALDAAGIVPNDVRTYPLADVKQAVAARYGAQPVLHCFQGAVLELWMCMSMDLEPITCPSHVGQRSSCGPHVRLPQGDPVRPGGGVAWVGHAWVGLAGAYVGCNVVRLLAARAQRQGR